jgi:hypothetical protein
MKGTGMLECLRSLVGFFLSLRVLLLVVVVGKVGSFLIHIVLCPYCVNIFFGTKS